MKVSLSPIQESIAQSPVLMEITEEYSNKSLSVGKGITLSLVIIGHGGVHNTLPLETFKLPKHQNVGDINVLGMRFSGLLNIVSRKYDEDVDKYLATHKNENVDQLIDELNKSFRNFLDNANIQTHNDPELRKILDKFLERVERIKQQMPKIGDSFFGTKLRFGKKNAQKFYQGISEKEKKTGARHSDLTTSGPLVKIYSLIKGDQEMLEQGVSLPLPPLPDGVTLTEIIDAAMNRTIEYIGERGEQLPINVNVVDLTCNYTENQPNIGFIE